MHKKLLFIFLLVQLILVSGFVHAQNIGINTTGTAPNCNTLLDLNTGNTAFNTANGNRGLLIPNISLSTTASQTDFPTGTCAIPDGLLVFNTNTAITGTGAAGEGYYYWSTTVSRWISIVANYTYGPWLLLGNVGITSPANPATYGTSTLGAAENWLGTTDANDLTFGTNNIERMRIKQTTGYIGIGLSAPTSLLHIVDATGSFTNGTMVTITANSLNSGKALYISSSSITTGNLVEIEATNAAGSTSNGLYIKNTSATGNAIQAFGNGNPNYSAIYATTAPTTFGSSWDISTSNHAIAGTVTVTHAYSSGVLGENTATGVPSAGVVGIYSTLPAWGALGYRSTAPANYGVYGSAAYASGAGYLSTTVMAGIGSGFYGGIIGSWIRGEVMGQVSCGELFATYNLGNAYTSGYSAEVVTVNDKRVPAYSVTSTDIKVYNDGTGKLTNGRIHVSFDDAFTELIGENKPVVTVTPMGQCNGVYITNVTAKGFDVVELNNGTSNVEFSYIVVGKRIDAAGKPQLPDAISKKDFDDKMKGVMHNESNAQQSGTPIWWDGKQIRFDAVPALQGEDTENGIK